MTTNKSSTPLQLQQVRISDQVADYIVRYIEEHQLEPGESLPSESELAKVLGVSRPSVREATNALSGRGLIAVSSGKSPTVLPLSKVAFSNLVRHGVVTQQVTAVQVLEVRCGLETQAAMMAAKHRTTEDIELFAEISKKLPLAAGNVEAFSVLDAEFHEALAKATHNPLMSIILRGIGEITFESARSGLSRARSEDEWKFILEVHLEIANAVIRGDEKAAAHHIKEHFDAALKRYEEP